MPPRTALATPLRAWRCPQCQPRTFSSSSRSRQVGPEHPRFIEIPEPPQQTAPYRPMVKGVLPIPRDIFGDKIGKARADDAHIARAAPLPSRPRKAASGSREEWNIKMAAARRRNLKEGLKGLHARREMDELREESMRLRRKAEQKQRLNTPEREDERLTARSHGLDLDALLYGSLQDPNRDERVAKMRARYADKEAQKDAVRKDNMHTLYMHARSFIVTPEQLDKALDESFGTVDDPEPFEGRRARMGHMSDGSRSTSVWALGAPMTVQDMLNRANHTSPRKALDAVNENDQINKERIRRIAEGLTGGKMDGDAQ